VLNFGSNWWTRFGCDPEDVYRFTCHAAYYNSTGVHCGSKVRRHWLTPGLLRFNAVGDFNPILRDRAIGRTFVCADLTNAWGGNRLLFRSQTGRSAVPDWYLVVISSGAHGRIDFTSRAWKSMFTQTIAEPTTRVARNDVVDETRGLGPDRPRVLAAQCAPRCLWRGGTRSHREARPCLSRNVMRYARGSFVITADGDIPLLRQVRNCRFVSHQQLFELLQYDALVSCRGTFNWRIQRLLKTGHIHRLEAICWQGSPVYTITQNGLVELESQGEFAIALHSRTRHMPDRTQVFHALELCAIRLSLARNALLISWQSEIEISSSNMISRAPYQKDYDAIVKIWVGDEVREFALEYESSLKNAKQYEK